jgi:hypothetical protein
LIASAPASSKCEGFGRVEKSRDGKQASLLRGPHNRRVRMRSHDQPAARSRHFPTCDGLVRVPAPISIRLPKLRDKIAMLSSGLGELRGTSTMRMPARSRAEQIDSASAG